MFETETETGTDAHGVAAAAAAAYDDLMFACTHLCELLEIENDALARHDPETVKLLAENKLALARLYEQSMRPLSEDPTLADVLPPEQREELRMIGLRLNDLVETNARRLKAEMEASQRLMDVIVGAVKQNASNGVSYGRGGNYGAKGAGANSLSFNKTL